MDERIRVEGEDDHHRAARDASEFAETGGAVTPVADGEGRHERVERVVAEGERLGNGIDRGSEVRRSLSLPRR